MVSHGICSDVLLTPGFQLDCTDAERFEEFLKQNNLAVGPPKLIATAGTTTAPVAAVPTSLQSQHHLHAADLGSLDSQFVLQQHHVVLQGEYLRLSST